ncbi:hypothetical protein P152DRAFT_172758 [Eremomyces bilateralis CBS 781.70]|uniref:Uncharacterized protein n=1 Tax=Eremomyces bilateralis CBS 781.70 TaxID=1392243 RepID=A0A6G1FTA3_9PEZI|nr:uncharacterized protein P152DRAFT_172758 [Eremomyces bilateralis CBS 781.70]KAF1808994.1 hypothetical protein P152DRAFT_172758 [Eremomyces bilateralis CBS 781.70]
MVGEKGYQVCYGNHNPSPGFAAILFCSSSFELQAVECCLLHYDMPEVMRRMINIFRRFQGI